MISLILGILTGIVIFVLFAFTSGIWHTTPTEGTSLAPVEASNIDSSGTEIVFHEVEPTVAKPETPEEPQMDRKEWEKLEELKKKSGSAEYEVIHIQDGSNLHSFETWPMSEKKYENERFLKPRGLGDKLHRRFKFIVAYKAPKPSEPLKKGETAAAPALIAITLKDKVDISSRLLFTVKHSHTLRKALVSLFTKPFGLGGFPGGKKLIFIFVIAAVAVVGYLIYSGNLNLGKIFNPTAKFIVTTLQATGR